MAHHTLSLEAPNTLNECILRIVDTSVYMSIPVSCPKLQITVPGFSTSVEIEGVLPGFNYNLTACDLEIQRSGCGTMFNSLPDGIYVIKYSVSPNDVVYAEYNHLRITKALDKLNKRLCELDIAKCAPNETTHKKLRLLGDIHTYLLAAKAKVEVCHRPSEGMQVYEYALSLLDKMDCRSCR